MCVCVCFVVYLKISRISCVFWATLIRRYSIWKQREWCTRSISSISICEKTNKKYMFRNTVIFNIIGWKNTSILISTLRYTKMHFRLYQQQFDTQKNINPSDTYDTLILISTMTLDTCDSSTLSHDRFAITPTMFILVRGWWCFLTFLTASRQRFFFCWYQLRYCPNCCSRYFAEISMIFENQQKFFVRRFLVLRRFFFFLWDLWT